MGAPEIVSDVVGVFVGSAVPCVVVVFVGDTDILGACDVVCRVVGEKVVVGDEEDCDDCSSGTIATLGCVEGGNIIILGEVEGK